MTWLVFLVTRLIYCKKKKNNHHSGSLLTVVSGCRFIKLSSGILQIINVQEGDTGSYRCHATQGSLHELPDEVDNIYGKTSTEASLEVFKGIIIFLSFRTDRYWQTVQTQIRLQSDQGLHCLQFPLHLLDALLLGNAILFNFQGDYNNFLGCPNI